MKLLPTRHPTASTQPSGQTTLGRGMDFALMVLVFLGIGYALDRWLGTQPVFMICLVLVAIVGQFAKIYYEYSAAMEHHEAQRAAARQGNSA